MANDGGAAVERHQVEAARLRSEIEALVRQAHVLLHGDVQAKRPSDGKPPTAKRAEREKELEANLEKADWYRREIKRLRQELEGRDQVFPSQHAAVERDPMELQNLIAEKRMELHRIQRSGEGLDRVAENQRRAEEAQRALRPDVEARLNFFKNQVELEKRKNVKLQADRLKLSNARKAAEEELRAAGAELRGKAALLQKAAKQPAAAYTEEESKVLRLLRRDIDILKTALQQDEKKFKAAEKEDEQEVEFAQEHIVGLKASMKEREAELLRLRGELGDLRPAARPQRPEDLLPKLPGSATAEAVPESEPAWPGHEVPAFDGGAIPESDEAAPEALPTSDSPVPESGEPSPEDGALEQDPAPGLGE